MAGCIHRAEKRVRLCAAALSGTRQAALRAITILRHAVAVEIAFAFNGEAVSGGGLGSGRRACWGRLSSGMHRRFHGGRVAGSCFCRLFLIVAGRFWLRSFSFRRLRGGSRCRSWRRRCGLGRRSIAGRSLRGLLFGDGSRVRLPGNIGRRSFRRDRRRRWLRSGRRRSSALRIHLVPELSERD